MSENTTSNHVSFRDAPVVVLGLGHIGLPTALGLAELGRTVIGADDDSAKVALIQAGQPPFYEPGLSDLLSKHLKSGKFRPVEDVEVAVRSGSIIFICVGTPQREDGQADLAQVENVARVVARNLNGYKLLVEKSTVPAITAQWLKRTILRYSNGRSAAVSETPASPVHPPSSLDAGAPPASFDVASNPEFLREGKALEDFFHPDRVVCGVESDRAREILTEIYAPLHCPIVMTDVSTAELIKHAANAFLSTKISFINMVADLCEKVGADATDVARGIGLDSRIGPQFLEAGIGYGGYCFPKDLRAFIRLAEEHGVEFSLLEEVERINQRRVDVFVKKVREALWILRGKTIGILGLAFKPGTDDIREAVSLKIIKALIDEGSILRLYDPQAMPNTRSVFPEAPGQLTYCTSAYEAARGAHALLLVTEWEEFRQLDLARLRDLVEVPVLVDGRNAYDPGAAREAGFEYFSIGRDAARQPSYNLKGRKTHMLNAQTSENHRPLTLVTGGAGFLGSHLCDRLLMEGHDVICLDNLITGRMENIQHLLAYPQFSFVHHDVTRPIDLPALLEKAVKEPGFSLRKLNYILHFASPASPKDYAHHPIHTLKVGALGTYHVLGLAKAQGSVFLQASTSEVYGDPEMSPQPETYWGHVNPIGPRSVYDEAKRYAEAISMAYRREHGVKVHIARIFNTYGERMRIDDGRALPNFMAQALQNQPLTVYGDGSQTRSLCYVSDLIEGLYRLLLSNETGPINIGNPEEITVLELAEAVIRVTQSRSRIVFEPLPIDDPLRRQPDITAAREKLGWYPRVCLEKGLVKALAHFRSLVHETPQTLEPLTVETLSLTASRAA